MSYKPTYESGSHKVICDICGRLYKAEDLQRRWDGFMVCPEDFENRHPQDFVRGVADFQAPRWTRPETANEFVDIGCMALFYYVDTTVSTDEEACGRLIVDADLILTGSITVIN